VRAIKGVRGEINKGGECERRGWKMQQSVYDVKRGNKECKGTQGSSYMRVKIERLKQRDTMR
jgi:hypothetical protein